ncbi:hypothetical protein [Rhizobium ruizarguesonis]|uniref:hypothetical protein n=1 Tax=Rhizobium ruizarguesonis TaxID=2081791 RepID=UPI00102FCF78|nr:hypothetical protein [Rhizobium ruizarguesonis]TBA50478.1 hypothetical protein ELH63_23790 [Rhizobium ruizarguesonis]
MSSVKKDTPLDKALRSLPDKTSLEEQLLNVWLRYGIEKGSRSLTKEPTHTDQEKATDNLSRAISLLEGAPQSFVRRHSDPQLFDTIVWCLKRMRVSWLAEDTSGTKPSERVDPLVLWAAGAAAQVYTDLTGSLLPRTYDYATGAGNEKEFIHDGLEFTYCILHQIDDDITRAMVATSLRKNVKSNSTA